jgi:hypothetical protein
MNERRRALLLAAVFVLGALLVPGTAATAFASATNIYLAEASAGHGNGADCSDAYAYGFFNNPSNWGSGATQIGPGTTVHLCGTFNAPAGTTTLLTVQANGASGAPITVVFEAGAVIQAPYFSGPGTSFDGVIQLGGHSFITVDGGTNGVIRATANGASLENHQASGVGVSGSGVDHVEIKNLTCQNLFVAVRNSGNNPGAGANSCVSINGSTFLTIDHNTFHDVNQGVYFAYEANNHDINIFSNQIYDVNTGIIVGSGNSGASLTNSSTVTNTIHDNDIHDMASWDAPGDINHHDSIHVWSTQAGSHIDGISEFNNYLHGTGGDTQTTYLYNECNTPATCPGSLTAYSFNNVIYNDSSDGDLVTGSGGNGLAECEGVTCFVYNNTYVALHATGNNWGQHMENQGGNPVVTIKNSVFYSLAQGAIVSTASTPTSDYNDAFDTGYFAIAPGSCAGGCTLAAWQSASGQDGHSVAGDPKLNSASSPPWQLSNDTSAAWGHGVNLNSLCSTIPQLCTDKNGTARPSSGPWDMGAYQNSTALPLPGPPTGLSATVH